MLWPSILLILKKYVGFYPHTETCIKTEIYDRGYKDIKFYCKLFYIFISSIINFCYEGLNKNSIYPFIHLQRQHL